MRVIGTCKEMNEYSKSKMVGFVPTMGFLHEGHLSLVKKSKKENPFTVVSIFVNPTQFSQDEDLDTYPKDFERDKKLLEVEGVDVLFFPSVEEMYPKGLYQSGSADPDLKCKLCGKIRKTHFDGVITIVKKLFDVVQPKKAYFGLKDYQQYLVIKDMCKRFTSDLEVVGCPIVREKDGLAMSSRNKYLTQKERKNASVIYRSLRKVQEMVDGGEKDSKKLEDFVKIEIEGFGGCVEYVKVVDPETLVDVNEVKKRVLIAVAAKFGDTRLIDNIVVKPVI